MYTPFNAFALSTMTAWAFGVRWFAFQWPIALTAAAIVLLAILMLRHAPEAERRGLLWPGLLLGGTSLVLATELSYPLWLLDTPLRNVQFPHRFISITTILAPMLAFPALAWTWRRSRAGWTLACVLAVHAALAVVVIAKTGLIDGQRITVAPDQFAPYTGLAEYRLRATGPDWPAYAERSGFTAECTRAGVRCSAMTREGRAMVWHIEAPARARLVLPVFAFPALQPSIDGVPVVGRADPATGLLVADVPAGASVISVAWRMLPSEVIGLVVSALTGVGLAGVAPRRRMRLSAPKRAAMVG